MNAMGTAGTPFLFVLDYALRHPLVLPLNQVDSRHLRYDLKGCGNIAAPSALPEPGWGIQDVAAIPFARYGKAFEHVRRAQLDGESYLLNLTASTPVRYRGRLSELLPHLQAPYRLWMNGSLSGRDGDGILVASPEAFVRIEGNAIRTFPMKGSLRCPPSEADAAAQRLLADGKEAAEHVTVVDLLRNDLARVSRDVAVPRYRFAEAVHLTDSVLLQTSSEVVGRLEKGWQERIGTIFRELLPAGSVTGAPKSRTCAHIARAEAMLGHERGLYCGVFGVFDGKMLESAVAIRVLEDRGTVPGKENLRAGIFKSGGGVTVQSDPRREWQELSDKISLPLPPILLETMRLEDGELQRREFHQRRLERSSLDCFGEPPHWSLEQAIAGLPDRKRPGRWKLRLSYTSRAWKLEALSYEIRRPRRLYAVEAGALDYRHKFLDRSGIGRLRSECAHRHRLDPADSSWDLLLVHEGQILEGSYAALVCRLDGTLRTPEKPLLSSTRIAAYLEERRVLPAPLTLEELLRADGIWLVNAMIDLEDEVRIASQDIVRDFHD